MKKTLLLSTIAVAVLTGSSFAYGWGQDGGANWGNSHSRGSFSSSMMSQAHEMENEYHNQAQAYETSATQTYQRHEKKARHLLGSVKSEARNEFNQFREQAHQLKEQLHQKMNQLMNPAQRHQIMKQLKQKFTADFQNFRNQVKQLRQQLLTATAEQREQIKEKIHELKQQFLQKMAQNLPADERAKFEQMLKQKEQLKEQVKQQIQQNYTYLTQTLKQKIDTILNQRLFKRLENLSVEKQEAVLNKILTKVNTILERLQQKDTNNPRVKIKLEVLEYLKQTVQQKLDDIKSATSTETDVNDILNSVLSGN